MSQKNLATFSSEGLQGRTFIVSGSGNSSRSESSTFRNPLIAAALKPMPWSSARSSDFTLMEMFFSCPKMSQKASLTKTTPFCSMYSKIRFFRAISM